MVERRATVMCYWGGSMSVGPVGLCYDCDPKRPIRLNRDTTYGELLYKLYRVMGLDRTQFTLKMTCRFPAIAGSGTINYIPVQIVDEDSVECMIDVVFENPLINSIDLYLEAERVSGARGGEVGQAAVPEPSACTTFHTPETAQQILPIERLYPGPDEPSELHLQPEHRSTAIWEGEDLPSLHCRRRYSVLGRPRHYDSLHPYLLSSGFYGVHRLGYIQLDCAFITALVERWRPETHTFHLPVGECTITLQDVAVLLGLPVDGRPITGRDWSTDPQECQDLCQRELGIAPAEADLDGSRLKLTWLATHFGEIPDGADVITAQRYARAYILQLIGGSLFADKSGNKVKLRYLTFLTDLHEAGNYSWGSAILATLYREMCRATSPMVTDIAGPLILLQLWGWERLSHIRPDRVLPRERLQHVEGGPDVMAEGAQSHADIAHGKGVPDGMAETNQPLPTGPLGCRWCTTLSLRYTPTHVLRYYRDQLDLMRDQQMIWQPYTEDVIATLPPYCLQGRAIWRTVVPLICFEIIEWHFPNRVMRQFGLSQQIPTSCDTGRELHGTDLRGRAETNWEDAHRQHLDWWGKRLDHIPQAAPLCAALNYDDPYLVWYRRITRRLVGPPAATLPQIGFQPMAGIFQMLIHRLTQIHARAEEGLADPRTSEQALQDIRQLCHTALQSIHSSQQLSVDPEPVHVAPAPIPVPRSRARGVVVPSATRGQRKRHQRPRTDIPSTSVPTPTNIPSTSTSAHQHHDTHGQTPSTTVVPGPTSSPAQQQHDMHEQTPTPEAADGSTHEQTPSDVSSHASSQEATDGLPGTSEAAKTRESFSLPPRRGQGRVRGRFRRRDVDRGRGFRPINVSRAPRTERTQPVSLSSPTEEPFKVTQTAPDPHPKGRSKRLRTASSYEI